jgi:hypothetical protein
VGAAEAAKPFKPQLKDSRLPPLLHAASMPGSPLRHARAPTLRSMAPRTVHRLRYALRLVFSVFLLSSPCGGQPSVAPPMSSSASP